MIIGISGYKKSGKDLVADYLIKNYPQYNFTKYSFALPLKKGVQEFFGWSDEQVGNQALKETQDPDFGISPREILQAMGTEVMKDFLGKRYPEFRRKCGKAFWVKRFEKTYKQNPQSCIIPDTRFQEELEAIKKLGGITIRVDRNASKPTVANSHVDLERVWKIFLTYRSQTLKFLLALLSPKWVPWYALVKGMLLIEHPSENIQKLRVDFVIANNGSIEDLYREVDKIMRGIHFAEQMKVVMRNKQENTP